MQSCFKQTQNFQRLRCLGFFLAKVPFLIHERSEVSYDEAKDVHLICDCSFVTAVLLLLSLFFWCATTFSCTLKSPPSTSPGARSYGCRGWPGRSTMTLPGPPFSLLRVHWLRTETRNWSARICPSPPSSQAGRQAAESSGGRGATRQQAGLGN